MVSFKGAYFARDIILTCVVVRGVPVELSSARRADAGPRGGRRSRDHQSRVLKYSPQLEAAFHRRKRPMWRIWRMDETYIRVRGHWHDLCRAVDTTGQTVDVLLTTHRDELAARRFLAKGFVATGGPRPSRSTGVRPTLRLSGTRIPSIRLPSQ